MIAALALAAMHPHERIYRLLISAPPHARVAVKATGPAGWLETVCTPRICGIGGAIVRIPSSGSSVSLVHVYRIAPSAPLSATVHVHAGGTAIHEAVRF